MDRVAGTVQLLTRELVSNAVLPDMLNFEEMVLIHTIFRLVQPRVILVNTKRDALPEQNRLGTN